MKHFFVAAAFCVALSAPLYAQNSAPDSVFEDGRSKKLLNINNRIAVLEAERDCIKIAKDDAELKKCKSEALLKRREMAVDQKQKK